MTTTQLDSTGNQHVVRDSRRTNGSQGLPLDPRSTGRNGRPGKSYTADAASLSIEAMREWLKGHVACIASGLNVGQIDRDKAQAFRLELIRRTS